jgi:hypothetical protein
MRAAQSGQHPERDSRPSCLLVIAAEILQKLAYEAPRNGSAARQSGAIEKIDKIASRVERAINVQSDELQDWRVDRELAIAEKLLKHSFEQFIVGSAQLDQRRKPQARKKIGCRKAPNVWLAPRRQEQARPLLAGKVEEMEEGCFRRADFVGGFDDERRLSRQRSKIGAFEHAAEANLGTRTRRPDLREMAFAGAWRTDQQQRLIRPRRPSLDHPQGCCVRVRNEEILAAEMRRGRQIQSELTPTVWLRRHVGRHLAIFDGFLVIGGGFRYDLCLDGSA